ncbi:type II toxin-antitoxin system VapC family toxin [Cyanobium sp. FGCU-6]|jgi:predicted nucleic acid-binding protein|nr:type II toxin-antitoxin system VapC family toxin [Cyanobium sp. FGCU6]
MERALMLLLDTNILIDVLRGEAVALAWLEQQQRPHISVITWIEVLVGCREGETSRVHDWLEGFPRLPLDGAIAAETVRLRQRHGLRIPDAIILATARCGDFSLATRNVRDFPLVLRGVVHPYRLDDQR